MRASHRSLFKMLFLFIILLSFLLPSYNLFLVNFIEVPITKDNPEGRQCSILNEDMPIYFKLTFLFVIKTTAIPFIIISVSNFSIIYAIYKKRRLLETYKRKSKTKNPVPQFRRVPFTKNKRVEEETNKLTLNKDLIKFDISNESRWSGKY